MSNVRLDKVDTAGFKIWSDIEASEKSLSELNSKG